MNTFNSKEYWNKRYLLGGNSGAGSYGRLGKYKADFINSFIDINGIKSLIEFGCGDGNNLSMIQCDFITGIDVSEKAIDLCKSKMNHSFFNNDEYDYSKQAELVTSLDVIYHLIEDDVYNLYMKNLCDLSYDWLIIYSANEDNDNYANHVRARKFTDHSYLNEYFRLIKIVKNKYPSSKYGPIHGSFADWYIYNRI